VVGTLRLYYDAVIAVALMAVVIVSGFIATVITGDTPPNVPIAAIAFVLICAFIFLRLWSKSRTSALPLG
jgi:hypothetical protein